MSGGIFLSNCIRKLNPTANSYKHITGAVKGPNAKAGHYLRVKTHFPEPSSTQYLDTLIIGSGISGLSAGRWLKKNNHQNFQILELEDHIGGNSYAAENKISAFPLGAHYITIANNHDKDLVEFLKELNVITGFERNLPVYNEYYLCFDLEERLLINGQWQEGLVPKFGITSEDEEQIRKFFELVTKLKYEKGTDDKYAFDIPLANSSQDEQFTKLDRQSFKKYLQIAGFDSPYLLWYINYCCKDDFGRQTKDISAWAGLHYFAAHKGKAANADDGAVLTWPEGNFWLVNQLKQYLQDHIKTSKLVYAIKQTSSNKIEVYSYDLLNQQSELTVTNQVILASPQFVNHKLLSQSNRGINYNDFNYSPWLTANITVKDFPDNGKYKLAWDNVAYQMKSIGYVYAGHQKLEISSENKNLTFYLPLCDDDAKVSRLAAYSKSYEQWLDIIIPEIEFMHPGITEYIQNIDIWLWGHGMIYPSVNFIWGENRAKALKPLNNQIFFAHTDLSGISIFEEGFYHGIRAAKEVLNKVKDER